MTRRFTALLLSCAMMLSLCQVSLATEESVPDEPIPADTATGTIDTETPAETPEAPAQPEIAASAPAALQGAGAVYTGSLGENVTWSLDTATGALTVTGAGDMGEYSAEGSPIWNYRSYVKSVAIADTVTSVSRFVFSGCTNLVTADLGNGVTIVGYEAFKNCKALTEIVIPDSVTSIGTGAFWSCESLAVITLGSSVTEIGDSAFYGCKTLMEIVIPDSVTTICHDAFRSCYNLSAVTIGSGVTKIKHRAFQYCSNLKKVTISDIASWMQIQFGTSDANPLYFAHRLYVGDELLTALVIPDTITDINEYALYNCTSITSVFVPKSVKTIGQYAFYGMTALNTVRYAGSQSDWAEITIGSYNESLTSLTPVYDQSISDFCHIATVTSEHGTVVLDGAMVKVGDTVSLVALPEPGYDVGSFLVDGVPIPDGSDTFTATKDHAVSAIFIKAYDVAGDGEAHGSIGADMIWALDTEGVLHIYGTGMMNGYTSSPFGSFCKDIRTVTFSGNVMSIGSCVFFNCNNMTDIVLPTGITSIGFQAFYGCNALTEIVIPESVTSIDAYAFGQCYKLAYAEFLGDAPSTFKESVFSDARPAFVIFYHSGTTGWTSPKWSNYPTVCRDSVVTDFSTLDSNNRNGQNVYFQLNPTSMTAVAGVGTTADNNAGYNGNHGGKVVIPDTVAKAGEVYNVIGVSQYAFANCPWVESVELGRYLSSIQPSAFRSCKNLKSFTVDANNLQYSSPDGVLYDKELLYLYAYPAGRAADTYDIPDTCVTVGTQSFFGAANLVSITVPGNVKNIGSRAFADCNILREITLPFIGASIEDNHTFNYVFGSDSWSANGGVPQSLKDVTVLNANLVVRTFYNCDSIENIYLPDCSELTEIPESCFYNCAALQNLAFNNSASGNTGVYIPNTVTDVGENSFYGCRSLPAVTLGSGVRTIWQGAFYGCDSLVRFSVAKGNTCFAADKWGVLYNNDLTVLRYYPSARPWPYYNVAETATTITESAFGNCKNLVNLFIPNSVTTFDVCQLWENSYGYDRYSDKCITSCPGLTVCCYKDSRTASYANSNGLTAWYMDNYTLQGLSIRSLPEQLVFDVQNTLVSTPYLTATYGDKQLQVDDYQVQLSKPYGAQTVTFTAGACSASAQATVIRQGDINGDSTTTASVVDVQDMQCLYEYLSTEQISGNLKEDTDYFNIVADVNGDNDINILDYQALYEVTKS